MSTKNETIRQYLNLMIALVVLAILCVIYFKASERSQAQAEQQAAQRADKLKQLRKEYDQARWEAELHLRKVMAGLPHDE